MGWSTALRAGSGIAVALAVALSACSNSAGGAAPDGSSTSPQVTTPRPSPTATDASANPADAVASVWQAVHDERLTQLATSATPDPAGFAGLATGQAVGQLADLVRAARGDIAVEVVDRELWPEVEVAASADKATIADCILVATRPADASDAPATVTSTAWTGTAADTGDGWRIDSVSVGRDKCVPRKLNQRLLDTYQAWHDAANDWWDPPDPDNPLLDLRMVDPGLTDMRELLTKHRSMGIVVRDPHDTKGAVVSDLGVGTARVSDCYPASPDGAAAYDQATGQRRTDLSPTPTPGQVDLTVVDFERTADGNWMANGWRSATNSDCVPGETPYVVVP